MLSFSRDLEAGRCAFADRHDFRFELNWRRVDGPPDFDRMLSDYAARLAGEGDGQPRRCDKGAWKGLSADVGGVRTTRFGRYFGDQGCLVELVFLWPAQHDCNLEDDCLSGFTTALHDGNRPQRWRAFGMDLLASRGLALSEVTVQPAHARLVFGRPTRGRCEIFERRGLVQEWLDMPLGEWLRRTAPPGMRVEGERRLERRGHEIHEVRCTRRLAPVRRALGLSRHFEAAAWICPRDSRLYSTSVSYVGKTAIGAGPFAGRILGCCEKVDIDVKD